MTKVFWRVGYGGDLDKQYMLDEGRLAWPRGISADDKRKFGKQMRVGHGAILGKVRGKSGLVTAVGRITSIDKHPIKVYEISVEWQELPDLYLKPEASGLRKWQKFSVFKFSDAHAKRHKFGKLFETHLPDDLEETSDSE